MEQNALQTLVDQTVAKTFAEFTGQKLAADQLAVTLVDLRDAKNPVVASYHGTAPIYPASVVKLFYLVAAHRQMEDGKLADTDELRRALSDMIVLSYNEATAYVVDLLTGTTSGPELPPAELTPWLDRREIVNRYFSSLGYTGVNASKKTWGEGPYGRDMQAVKISPRNFLTTDATARLLVEIVTGHAVSAARSEQMMALLKRNFSAPDVADGQARDFTALGLPPDAKLWSKAGWMSTARHDAAYVELANGARFVLVTFTVDHAHEKEIIPFVTRAIVEGLNA
jgi:beta-lactamase class A